MFKQTAPIIKLDATATEADHIALLGWLNSSAVCFWMKQVCMNKGAQGINEGFKSEAWEQFHQFASTKLLQLPVPTIATEFAIVATQLSKHAETLQQHGPSNALRAGGVEALATAQRAGEALLHTMVGLQEELDWQWYESLGILEADDLEEHRVARQSVRDAEAASLAVAPGHRAFECVLHRSAEETAWFERNGYALPTDEALAVYPPAYRALIEVRADLIERNRFLGLLERPEYKRRWTRRDWDAEVQSACTDVLLDGKRCMSPVLDRSLRDRHDVVRDGRSPISRSRPCLPPHGARARSTDRTPWRARRAGDARGRCASAGG
jgi:hypothetical protein